MAPTPPSRGTPTLADLLAAIAEAGALPAHRRRDMASAVRRAARLLGREPALLPADPRLLARRLAEVAPAAHGLSRPGWNNLRSLLGAALGLLGPVSPGRRRGELIPEWKALWGPIPSRRLRRALSRLVSFCSREGIRPEAVDEAVLARFGAALENSLLKSPAQVVRDARRAWTLACAEVPGWPDRPFAAPARPDRYALSWPDFPASLHADARGWLDRLGGAGHDDPFEDERPFRPVRPSTLAAREGQLLRLASALVRRGRDPASLRSLADLVEVEAIKEGLRFHHARRGGRFTSAMHDLAATLKAIAEHWVGADKAHLDRLRALMRRMDLPGRALTARNRARLRALDDPATRAALLRLPERLLALAGRTPQPRRAALLMQQALAVDILLLAPMRGGNLAAVDRERHLVQPGPSRAVRHIVFEPHEVKNRELLDYPLTEGTLALLDRYLAEAWPRLATAPGCTALFPGRGGRPKGRAVLGRQIRDVVFRHTGLRITQHFFRHAGAKLYLDARPGEYETMRRVLAHRSMETTVGYYAGLESAAAVRHFDRTILGLRRGDRGDEA